MKIDIPESHRALFESVRAEVANDCRWAGIDESYVDALTAQKCAGFSSVIEGRRSARVALPKAVSLLGWLVLPPTILTSTYSLSRGDYVGAAIYFTAGVTAIVGTSRVTDEWRDLEWRFGTSLNYERVATEAEHNRRACGRR